MSGRRNEQTFLRFRLVFLVADTWAACSAFFDFCKDDFLSAFLDDFLAAFFRFASFRGRPGSSGHFPDNHFGELPQRGLIWPRNSRIARKSTPVAQQD
jgi:hypothetical protein